MKRNLLFGISLSLVVGCTGEYVPQDGTENPGVDAGDPVDQADAAPPIEPDNRVIDQLQVLYRFEGAPGQTVIEDVSGVGEPYNLTIRAPELATWEGGYLTFTEPNVVENLAPLTKVYDACTASNELTLEVWVKNATIENTGYLLTSSQENTANVRNFGFHQTGDNWDGHLRTNQNNQNGSNPSALAVAGTATIETQHIVYTRDSSSGVADFWINGVKQVPRSITGNFGNWLPEYGLYVGNEPNLARPWQGTIYLAAVYCKDLTPAEIQQNYAEGY